MKTTVLGFILAVTPVVANAQQTQMEWTMTSTVPYNIQLEFFSHNRNIAWPGRDRAYYINDYLRHTYILNCQIGEKICYGAWPTGGDVNGRYSTYWGVGGHDEQSCTDCCAICGESNPNMRLR